MFNLILIVASIGVLIGGVVSYWLANKAEGETVQFRIIAAAIGAFLGGLGAIALLFVFTYAAIIFFPVIFLAIFIAFKEDRKSRKAI